MNFFVSSLNVKVVEGLWRAILEMKTEGPRDRSSGICNNVRWTQNGFHLDRETAFLIVDFASREWAKFSGVLRYPVPGVDGESPAYTYIRYSDDGDMWNPEDPYGKLRNEFLDHLLAYTTTLMKDYTEITRQIGNLK